MREQTTVGREERSQTLQDRFGPLWERYFHERPSFLSPRDGHGRYLLK
jgi:hypothetical protein